MAGAMKHGADQTRGNAVSRLQGRLLKRPRVKEAYDEQRVVLEAARFIRNLRESAGLTQTELAETMGVSQAVIARLEMGQGKRGITIAMLARVAAACNQSLVVKPSGKKGADNRLVVAFSSSE